MYAKTIMPSKNKKRRCATIFGEEIQIYSEDMLWALVKDYCKLHNIAVSDFLRGLIINNFAKDYIKKFGEKNDIRK